MEQKWKDLLTYFTFFLSVTGIILGSWNFYNSWYVPPRAELSVINDTWSYNAGGEPNQSENTVVNINGIITNEGERNTCLKSISVICCFHQEGEALTRIITERSALLYVEKQVLSPKEATNFTINISISRDFIIEHMGIPEELKEVLMEISHDDGLGSLTDSKKITILN